MKRFAEINVGDEFYSECMISFTELDAYLLFSGIKNIIYENKKSSQEKKMVSGRAILSKMEGEFTRLEEMYGNHLVFYGVDGDQNWNNRQTRFLKPLYTGDILKIKFVISEKREINDEFGLIGIDFEGKDEEGRVIVISKRNLYQIKKDLPVNQL
ncbi:MAG: hotdog family protein [Nitrosotalea sp.]